MTQIHTGDEVSSKCKDSGVKEAALSYVLTFSSEITFLHLRPLLTQYFLSTCRVDMDQAFRGR